jgi:hypothetical protein
LIENIDNNDNCDLYQALDQLMKMLDIQHDIKDNINGLLKKIIDEIRILKEQRAQQQIQMQEQQKTVVIKSLIMSLHISCNHL